MPAGTVEVYLIGASGIKDTEIFGKADPYAILICGKTKLRSNTASNQGSRPLWNQKFNFTIDDTITDVKIRIFNHNVLSEDDEIGSSIIPLTKAFTEGKLPTTSYNVVRPSGRVQGEVKLSVEFVPKKKVALSSTESVPGPYGSRTYSSPYKPEPFVKHDPLTGPNGYYRTDSNSSSTSLSHSSSSVSGGTSKPSKPITAGTYPQKILPPDSLETLHDYVRNETSPYQHPGGKLGSGDGSSQTGMYPPPISSYAPKPTQSFRYDQPPSAHESSSQQSAPTYTPVSTAALTYPPPVGYVPPQSKPQYPHSPFHDARPYPEELVSGVATLGIGESSSGLSSQGGYHGYPTPPFNSSSYVPPNAYPPTGYPPSAYPSFGSSHAPPPAYAYPAPPASPSYYPPNPHLAEQTHHAIRPYPGPVPSAYPEHSVYGASSGQYPPARYP